jgi:hypothetical protein
MEEQATLPAAATPGQWAVGLVGGEWELSEITPHFTGAIRVTELERSYSSGCAFQRPALWTPNGSVSRTGSRTCVRCTDGATSPRHRAKVRETQRLMAELPDEDKVVLFDRHRKVVESMANLDRATPEQTADLIRLLVERAEAKDRLLMTDAIVWTPPVRPFFERLDDVAERPRTDSNRQQQRSVLDWYLEAG